MGKDGEQTTSEKHDHHNQVRHFLIIHDLDCTAFWAYDACKTAKEHRAYKKCRNQCEISRKFFPHGTSVVCIRCKSMNFNENMLNLVFD